MSALTNPTRSTTLHGNVITIILAANLLFWVYFWVDFATRVVPYEPRQPKFEEVLPTFVFYGKALPTDQERRLSSLRLAKVIHAPSFWAAQPYVWITVKRGMLWDKVYWGVSPGGYFLLIAMGVSFVQWFLVGLVVRRLLRGPSTPVTSG
jgi:hypothetical protein